MIKISVVYPFYNNLHLVYKQFELFSKFDKDLLKQLELVLVDDCSSDKLDISKFKSTNLNISIYQIKTNIKWNQGGAHNLGNTKAKGEWIFNLDIDHILTEEMLQILVNMDKEKDMVYYFNRYLKDEKYKLKSAPNIYLMRKKVFTNLSGYDEDFCGHYGKEDKLFQYIIKQKYDFQILSHLKIEVTGNGGTRGLDRDTDINTNLVHKKIQEYREGTYRNGKILRFRWKELYKNG